MITEESIVKGTYITELFFVKSRLRPNNSYTKNIRSKNEKIRFASVTEFFLNTSFRFAS